MKVKIIINVEFSYNAMLKKIFIIKNVKCDISNFSEFYQEYKYVCHILFYLSWIFAGFVA